jgi:uncharacterized protein (TIGR00369 family)
VPDSDHPYRARTGEQAAVAAMNAFNTAIPYNAWLGAEVVAASEDSVKVRVPWRVEFGGAPGMTHGGVLAGVIDMTAFVVLMATRGGAGPTIDMRVDFHRSTVNGTFYALGKLLRAGKTISTVEVLVQDSAKRLIASGRCVFLSHPRKSVTEEPARGPEE